MGRNGYYGILVGLLVLSSFTAASCVQPVDGVAPARENFDTTRPATPSANSLTAPTQHTLNGETLNFFSGPPTFQFNLTPGAPGRYRINGGAWIGPDTALPDYDATGLGDGRHTLEVEERDASGNWSETYSYRFVIDSVNPQSPKASPSNPTVTSNLTPTFFWFGDEADGQRAFLATIAGPGVPQMDLPLLEFPALPPGSEFSLAPVTFAGSGLATLTLQEYDYAGRLSDPSTITITIDVDGPILTGEPSSPTNQASGNSWSWQSSGAENADGQFEYELRTFPLPGNVIDAGAFSATPASYTAPTLGEGSYQLRIRESRNGGAEWSAWSDSTVLTIDLTPPPAPTLTASPAPISADPTPSFTWNGSGEAGASFTYEIKGATTVGPTTVTGSSYTAPALPDGEYTFSVFERDTAGNNSAVTQTTFEIDTTPPNPPTNLLVSGLTGTAPNRYVDILSPQYSWSSGGGGNGQYRWSFNGGANVAGNLSVTSVDIATSQGIIRFTVQERDEAGNWSAWATPVEFIYDPLYLAQLDLHLDVGAAVTGDLTIQLRRGTTTLMSWDYALSSYAGTNDWISFNTGDLPLVRGETVTLHVSKSTAHDFNNGDYVFWSSSPIDTNPYGATSSLTSATNDGDFGFRAYIKNNPAAPLPISPQQQVDVSYGYFLNPTFRWQGVLVPLF